MIKDLHALLPIAYRAASQVLRNRVLAEEAGERALHQLTLSTLLGSPPSHPKAWLRSVARRSACALLSSEWGKTKGCDHAALQERQAPYVRPRDEGIACVRERLTRELPPRQREALEAAVSCNSTRAAAQRCGMRPRDFRRSLLAISRKARVLIEQVQPVDPFADAASVQFQLDP